MAGAAGTTRSKNSSPEYIGKKYWNMTVIAIEPYTRKNGNHMYMWRCRCDCGNERLVAPTKLKSGSTKSCGCGKIARIKADVRFDRTTHGGNKERLHNIWCSMRSRCGTPTCKDYPSYGGRGIAVCAEWNDYVAFRDWALSHGYDDTLTIERKDVNGNYCPENCCWIPLKDQNGNKRTSHWVEYNGERHIVSDWARIYGMDAGTLHNRLRLGWSMDSAISTPNLGLGANGLTYNRSAERK